MTLLGIAATVALLLGAIGLFGVISYVVSQRTREIGVRVALGARGEDVQRMIVRQGVAVLIGGVTVGLLGAFALTRLMGAVLYEVSAADPWTFAGAPVVLVIVSLLASWLPARRATKVDPVTALRAEVDLPRIEPPLGHRVAARSSTSSLGMWSPPRPLAPRTQPAP